MNKKRLQRCKDNEALSGKRPKLKSRKWYVRNLDHEISSQVRSLHQACFFCLGPVECAFHVLSRKSYGTRWDIRNVTASCMSCNLRMEHDASFVANVVNRWREAMGIDQWDEMVNLFHTPTKFSRSDLAAMLDELKNSP